MARDRLLTTLLPRTSLRGARSQREGPSARRAHTAAWSSDGSVLIEQVVLYDSPAKLRIVAENGFEEFSRPLPWTFRANVSGPGFGPPHTETSAADFMARLTGRWAWCSGQFGGTNSIGLEFLGDGTWYGLVEDEAGNVTRQATGSLHGTVQVPSEEIRTPPQAPQPAETTGPLSGNGVHSRMKV
jgi:hypothetical protein